jgi:hypothetical protein
VFAGLRIRKVSRRYYQSPLPPCSSYRITMFHCVLWAPNSYQEPGLYRSYQTHTSTEVYTQHLVPPEITIVPFRWDPNSRQQEPGDCVVPKYLVVRMLDHQMPHHARIYFTLGGILFKWRPKKRLRGEVSCI